MGAFVTFLVVYLLGGLTLIPLLITAVLVHAHLTFPVRGHVATPDKYDSLVRDGDNADTIKESSKDLDERFHHSKHEFDVAAGYFAVCREYVPGGINGKPPERTTPTGSTTISNPSPSVYQSMYRSIFDRKQNASPLDNKGAGKPPRKAGNIFYVVLRHSHLLLFDDVEMLEVRYVLSLAHHNVSIYGGGEDIPDGELFIKRNALCLTRKNNAGEMTPDGTTSKPFFLFADNTSEKEDFYFAMLKNQEREEGSSNNPPVPLQFDIKDMIGLVQRLHSSEEHLQTRWINAILGRIFLGLYKTSDVENFIRAKITKKISRVKKPSFLSKVVLHDVDMGEGAPFITNPRLKDLTVDGDCSVEADVRYTGNFRLEIAATAGIDLGTRLKAREVNLLLAVVLKKIEGHVILRIKPPPSNRIWFTFAQAPKIEMSIEPIVSTRQITYTFILRQIENRIKEVIAESIVMPYWDDIAFYSTEGKKWRGGVWVDDTPKHATAHPQRDAENAAAEDGVVDQVEHLEAGASTDPPLPSMEKSTSVPILEGIHSSTTHSRKGTRSLFNMGNHKTTGSSTSVEATKSSTSETPKVLRQGSFASASTPVIGTDITTVDAFKSASPPPEYSDAASKIAAISARSHSISTEETPVGSLLKESYLSKNGSHSSVSSGEPEINDEQPNTSTLDTTLDSPHTTSDLSASNPTSVGGISQHSSNSLKLSTHEPKRRETISSSARRSSHSDEANENDKSQIFINHERRQDSIASTKSTNSSENPPTPPKGVIMTTVANAVVSARRWGMNAMQKNQDQSKEVATERNGNSHRPSQPMGRGRPIPFTDKNLPPKSAPVAVPQRGSPILPKRPQQHQSDELAHEAPAIPVRRPLQQREEPDKNASDIPLTSKEPPPYQNKVSTAQNSPSDHSSFSEMDRVDPRNNTIARSNIHLLPLAHRQNTRHRRLSSKYDGSGNGNDGDEEGIFVVEAPEDEDPTTPLTETGPVLGQGEVRGQGKEQVYFPPSVADANADEMEE